MSSSIKRYHKGEIAREQLKTALALFLNKIDLSSVITLAGAAGNILHQLVQNRGQEPFVDLARRFHNELLGFTPPRKKYGHYIDNKLGIISHKHMGPNCLNTVKLDLQECAVRALTKAMGDYTTLYGKEEAFTNAFYHWAWKYQDGPKVMEQYKNLPARLKKNERRDT
jgi:hypothetical protein